MSLDFFSMALLIAINLAVMGLVLPLVMGSPVSEAAQHAQRSFLVQAMSWVALLTASRLRGLPVEPWISVLGTVLATAAQWQLCLALQGWLGPRPLRRLVLALCILAPLGFTLLLGHIAQRMAWFSVCYGLIVACLGWMCLFPQRPTARAWRYLLATCTLVIAGTFLTRAYLALAAPALPDFTSNTQVNHVFALLGQLCSSLSLISALVAWRDETSQQLRDQALTDQLTGLANRHALLQQAPRMLELAQRQQLPLAVLMLDLDHFKSVNDQHGHAMGDRALQVLAQVMRSTLRSDEIAARWGGEEFCVMLYGPTAAAENFYQRLSSALSHDSEQILGFGLQLSAGCAIAHPTRSYQLEPLLQQADVALYLAKHRGRGQLVVADAPVPPPLAPARASALPPL